MNTLIQEHAIYSRYFAPRGKERLLFLGEQISHRHLRYGDRLIGVIGDAGSGKSSLIQGMFPGLELTNNDDVMNPAKIMQVRDIGIGCSQATTFHIDMRFQMAFTQTYEIVDFITAALDRNRRVVVEHFNLLYPALQVNADIIVGIGEEILVVHPTIFGPHPDNIYGIMHTSLKYRKMAHTVEDIAIHLLEGEFGIEHKHFFSSDVRNGFILRFTEEMPLDFERLARRIQERLAENLPVRYSDETHIMIGDDLVYCTGPRLHLGNTAEVENFRLVPRFIPDSKTQTYCLVGLLRGSAEDVCCLNNFVAESFF